MSKDGGGKSDRTHEEMRQRKIKCITLTIEEGDAENSPGSAIGESDVTRSHVTEGRIKGQYLQFERRKAAREKERRTEEEREEKGNGRRED